MKKLLAVVLTVVLAAATVLMTGCGSDGGSSVGNDKEILVVSFGTSYNESRNITIGAVEAAIGEAKYAGSRVQALLCL